TETGFAYMFTQEPVTTVADLGELKAWIPDNDPIAAELIKSFNVSPIPLNITDVLAGLQTGLINAVVAPPSVALALQWHNHVKYMTDLPLLYIYSTLAMSEKAYKRISADDKQIVRGVMDRVFTEVGEEARADNAKALQAISTIGIEIVEPANLEEWQKVADESVERLIGSGEISPEAVRLYLDNLEQYRAGQ
ncbi:MAG: TRAP transporter substrate-binding protein DctP, partial [Pseudomonadales bacterium]|nr:TRAP transporter substrate-binding protein DctP [Pseudomonadales bacterium]